VRRLHPTNFQLEPHVGCYDEIEKPRGLAPAGFVVVGDLVD